MAGIALKIEMDGLKGLEGRLNALASFGDVGRRALLSDIGEEVISQTRQRFRDEKAPDGTTWKKSKRAEAEGGQTLTDTGRLKNSINRNLGVDFVEVGTNVVYGAIHQLGGEAGKGHAIVLPPRPYLPEGIEQVDSLDTMVDALIARLVGGL